MRALTLYFYVWLMTVFFGSILSETVILYPNIFHDVPNSLEAAMNFLKVIGPRQFFTAIGSVLMLTALIANSIHWRNREARPYLVGSFVMLLTEFLFSMIYFWPRNTIMFMEGSAVHTTERLKHVANEFLIGHWIRLSIAFIASVLAFLALLRTRIKDSQP